MLRQTVADFFETSAENVSADFPLAGPRLKSSMSRAMLDGAIRRRVGIKSRAVYTAKTFGDLETALLGSDAIASASNVVESNGRRDGASVDADGRKPVAHDPIRRDAVGLNPVGLVAKRTVGATNPVSCGVDIERIDNLPRATDYREHDFYASHFTPAEIAYCVSQPIPMQHFAARWAAKEALAKCDATWLDADMNTVEIRIDGDGRPSLYDISGSSATPLSASVSLSHTDELAIALVVRLSDARTRTDADSADGIFSGSETDASNAATILPSPKSYAPTTGGGRLTLIVMATVAIVVSVWALVRTF
jgi:phosphopantetheine--protein transferase-like protein